VEGQASNKVENQARASFRLRVSHWVTEDIETGGFGGGFGGGYGFSQPSSFS
jgi:hypothetical protein